MPRWSSEIIPTKYKHLDKKLDAILDELKTFPEPRLDLASLKPEDRDIFEIFLICQIRSFRDADDQNYTLQSSPPRRVFDKEIFDELFSRYLTDEERSRIDEIITNTPDVIKKYQPFWVREERLELMRFLREQAALHKWIPQSGFNEEVLTWVSWERLLNLAEKHGYSRERDDILQLQPLEKWTHSDRKSIVRIYLEMNNSLAETQSFLALEKDYDKHVQLPRRLPLIEDNRGNRSSIVSKRYK